MKNVPSEHSPFRRLDNEEDYKPPVIRGKRIDPNKDKFKMKKIMTF